MRSVLVVMILAADVGAEPQPIYEAELRMGYGLAMGGGGGAMASMRATPLTVTATGSIAVRSEPALAGYAGLTAETVDRNAIGAVAGVRLSPGGPLRLAAGATALIAPYTLWGATASGGACGRLARGVKLCGDLELIAYVAGSDLAPGHTVTQVQGVLGLVLDGF